MATFKNFDPFTFKQPLPKGRLTTAGAALLNARRLAAAVSDINATRPTMTPSWNVPGATDNESERLAAKADSGLVAFMKKVALGICGDRTEEERKKAEARADHNLAKLGFIKQPDGSFTRP